MREADEINMNLDLYETTASDRKYGIESNGVGLDFLNHQVVARWT